MILKVNNHRSTKAPHHWNISGDGELLILFFKIYFSRCDNSNSKYATVSAIPEAAFKRLLSAAHIAFQKANSEIEQAQKLQKNLFDKMLSRLTKGQSIPGGKITIEDTTEQDVKPVSEIVE